MSLPVVCAWYMKDYPKLVILIKKVHVDTEILLKWFIHSNVRLNVLAD